MIVEAQATPRLARKVIDCVREVTDKPISHLELTHYHAVRVLGPVLTLRVRSSCLTPPPWLKNAGTRIGPANLAAFRACFRGMRKSRRYGCGQAMLDKGVVWNLGKVFFDDRQIYDFDLLPEEGHRYPAFINLQQPYVEKFLFDQIVAEQAKGAGGQFRACRMSITLAGNWAWCCAVSHPSR